MAQAQPAQGRRPLPRQFLVLRMEAGSCDQSLINITLALEWNIRQATKQASMAQAEMKNSMCYTVRDLLFNYFYNHLYNDLEPVEEDIDQLRSRLLRNRDAKVMYVKRLMLGTVSRIEEEGGSPEYVAECRRVVREVCANVVTCVDEMRKQHVETLDKMAWLYTAVTEKYKMNKPLKIEEIEDQTITAARKSLTLVDGRMDSIYDDFVDTEESYARRFIDTVNHFETILRRFTRDMQTASRQTQYDDVVKIYLSQLQYSEDHYRPEHHLNHKLYLYMKSFFECWREYHRDHVVGHAGTLLYKSRDYFLQYARRSYEEIESLYGDYDRQMMDQAGSISTKHGNVLNTLTTAVDRFYKKTNKSARESYPEHYAEGFRTELQCFSRILVRYFEQSITVPHDQALDGLFNRNTVDIDVHGDPAHMAMLDPEWAGFPPGIIITQQMTNSNQQIRWEHDQIRMNVYEGHMNEAIRIDIENCRRPMIDFQRVIQLYEQSSLIPLIKDNVYNASVTSLTGVLLDRVHRANSFLELTADLEFYSLAVFDECNGLAGVVNTMKVYGKNVYPNVSSRLYHVYIRQIQEVRNQWENVSKLKALLADLKRYSDHVISVFSSRIKTH